MSGFCRATSVKQMLLKMRLCNKYAMIGEVGASLLRAPVHSILTEAGVSHESSSHILKALFVLACTNGMRYNQVPP
jgi:hypothetical protein